MTSRSKSMDSTPPLGALDAFKRLASPRQWGPDKRWSVAFGGRVVQDELIAGLRAHRSAVEKRFSPKAEAYPVVLGCVPWLDSDAIVDALIDLGSCCIVVDKKTNNEQCMRLLSEASGVQQRLLGAIATWGPPERGRPPVIGPSSPLWDRELEPLRVAGWKKADREKSPLLHAKLAICCAAWRWEGEAGGTDDVFTPMSVWMGSANWTKDSPKHLELGAWSTDAELATAALEFVTAVIKISEMYGAGPGGPEPQLVEGEWDDAAFAEVLGEMELDDDEG